ncbi:hypothetical protein PSSM7_187 [Prochlorococcus phage P-SSM7]|uniref:Uncharacterized protein n=1 Tax=Prochlorococcus phage P-SSM7 TaxID=445688 RepID=E3SNV1_9CAUD|nr:hypothetical protein PSSM7_187 [Prochlorococcus phage P-SSM7]ADO98920.1 hypothetical protein PSSM7_187 [Prochlorococcus phage P-SSM7]
MPLSEQVETSLIEAQENLRNALSFAARTEKPYISKHIADMLSNIDNIIHVVPLLEQVEDGLNDSL